MFFIFIQSYKIMRAKALRSPGKGNLFPYVLVSIRIWILREAQIYALYFFTLSASLRATIYLILNPLCLIASYTTTAAALETFIESIFPSIGMIILAVAFFTQISDNPVASVPMTMAHDCV